MIKQISSAIGSEYLSETFKEIKEKNDSIAYNLIDTSIKLEFFKDFPHEEIKKLKEKLTEQKSPYTQKGKFPVGRKYNTLPFTILKQMVINYLYMFPVDAGEKQRICSMLEIPIQTQLLIGAISTQKKR